MNADAVAAALHKSPSGCNNKPHARWKMLNRCDHLADAALAAAPLPEPVYDFAWLIERGQPEGQVPTVWWWLAAGGREGWTEVATEAFHFESREAAEEIIAAKFTPPTSRGEASARAVEHSFIAATPLPSDTPANGLDVERRRSMKKQGRSTFLLMSEFEQLEEWCRLVRTVFDGETPFLVGSVHSKPTFRDVDLRLILPDAAFDDAWRDPVKVRLMNRAISVWGQQETSLPIDFQIQRMTEANEQFGGEFRNPMGVRDWTAIPTSGIPRPDTDQEDRP